MVVSWVEFRYITKCLLDRRRLSQKDPYIADFLVYIPRLCLVSYYRLLTKSPEVSIDVQSNVLELKWPGLHHGTQDFLKRTSLRFVIPFSCSNAEFEDLCVDMRQCYVDALRWVQLLRDEVDFREDAADLRESLSDLSGELFVVEGNL